MAIAIYEIVKYEDNWPDDYDCGNVPTTTIQTTYGPQIVNTSYRCTFSPTLFGGFSTEYQGGPNTYSIFLGYVDDSEMFFGGQSNLIGNLGAFEGLGGDARNGMGDLLGQARNVSSDGSGYSVNVSRGFTNNGSSNSNSLIDSVRNTAANLLDGIGVSTQYIGVAMIGVGLAATILSGGALSPFLLYGVGALAAGTAATVIADTVRRGPGQEFQFAEKSSFADESSDFISSNEDDDALLDALDLVEQELGVDRDDLIELLKFATVDPSNGARFNISTEGQAAKGTNAGDNISAYFGDDVILARGGNDVVYSSFGDDNVNGGGGDDSVFAGSGNDIVTAGLGEDYVDAGRGNDTVRGGQGDDELKGGGGDDTLLGQADADILIGGQGDDVLKGGSGNDVLAGGFGDDILTGGKDADRFVFFDGGGRDYVMDFDAIDIEEKIDLRRISEITSFDDLQQNHMTQSGSNVIIKDGIDVVIILRNTTETDLDAASFLF